MRRNTRLETTKTQHPIDFVVTWVDGNDRIWQAKKAGCSKTGDGRIDSSDKRYRDWGFLRYLFRSIETFAPWANKVFLVTCGHTPEWLNMDAAKLVFVKHEDYMPQKYLPTFSSHPIELNLHRIAGLSEHFININDDIILTRSVQPDFFFKQGLPVLCPELHAILPKGHADIMAHIYVNNISATNRHFDFKRLLQDNKSKWFNPKAIGLKAVMENIFCAQYSEMPGIRPLHLAYPLLKSTLIEVWHSEPELLDHASLNRFRSAEDVSQQIFWYWQMASGKFVPQASRRLGRSYDIDKDLKEIVSAVRKQKYAQVCANDMGGFENQEEFERAKNSLLAAFESILPDKSTFEF